MFHTVHCVALRIAGEGTIKVNPIMVGAVYTDSVRDNRVYVIIGGVKERVVGTEAEVLSALGWTSVPVLPADPAVPAPLGGKSAK
jgi:hypothetical protein